MKKVKFETNGASCVTFCPFVQYQDEAKTNVIRVGSCLCSQCKYFKGEQDHVVLCTADEIKVLNDFLWWLAVGGILNRYWSAVEYACWDKKVLQSDFIKQMDANRPETLFDLPIRCGFSFFKETKEKYINWLKRD